MGQGQEGCTSQVVKVGKPVPDICAQVLAADGSFKNVKLSDYKGKWVVLFFYPLDFTFVCPTEIQGFNAKYDEFQKLGAEVLTASTDSVFSHKAWQEHGAKYNAKNCFATSFIAVNARAVWIERQNSRGFRNNVRCR